MKQIKCYARRYLNFFIAFLRTKFDEYCKKLKNVDNHIEEKIIIKLYTILILFLKHFDNFVCIIIIILITQFVLFYEIFCSRFT